MVFAVALHLDLAQHDDVVIALHVFEGAREFLGRIELVALEPLPIGVDDALGGVDHAFTAGIVAGPRDQRAHSFHSLFARWALHGFKIKTGRADQGSVATRSVHD